MGRRTWAVSLVSAAFVLLAGCAALTPPGTRYAQMDFHQFTASAIANDDPELARRFGATRAAVCQGAVDHEMAPCISLATTGIFTTPDVPKDPELRLVQAFENWCAVHGGQTKLAVPGWMGRMGRDPRFYFSDFGTVAAKLTIVDDRGMPINKAEPPHARQCVLGPSSVGLITTALPRGPHTNAVIQRLVLALFYDEKDLVVFTKSTESTNSNGTR